MKIINKKLIPKAEEKKFISEIQILKQLDHPNILKLYEFYEDRTRYFIIMELCLGGELFDQVIDKGQIDEPEAAMIMTQVLGAIRYAHNNNVAHRFSLYESSLQKLFRDIKPENILLDKHLDGTYNIKIIDWGAG